MICPSCWTENLKVLESRDAEWGLAIRRRRECNDCNYRFTTFERIDTNFLVVKKDWTREMYNRKKIQHWVELACNKRPISKEQIDEMFYSLEQNWNGQWKEILSLQIWEDVMNALKELDEVAYLRFLSVYRNLSVEEMKKELGKFLRQNKKEA